MSGITGVKSRMYEIYGLIDPRSGVVFYIGCSKKLRERLLNHGCDPASAAWPTCQELKALGLKPGVRIFGRLESKQAARTLEAQLTALMPHVVNSKRLCVFPGGNE